MFPQSLPHGVMIKSHQPLPLGSSACHASHTLEFTSSLKHPITITSIIPLTAAGKGKAGYRISMPVKKAKTAVGLRASSESTSQYLTPSYEMSEGYVSMGGAGFIYPSSRATGCRYGEGDSIEIEVDWMTRMVFFRTSNGQEAQEEWLYGDSAFLAISSDGGPVLTEIQAL